MIIAAAPVLSPAARRCNVSRRRWRRNTRFGRPVERVVECLVSQLLDEPALVQRDRGMVGDGLEQLGVRLVERAHRAHPVGDVHHPDHADFAVERHDDRLPEVPVLQVRADDAVPGVACEEDRLALQHPALDRVPHGRFLRAGEPPVGREADPHPGRVVGRREHRGGVLGVQQLARLFEHVTQHVVALGRRRHDLAELVEAFEAQVAFAQPRVGPEADDEHDTGRGEQPGGPHVERKGSHRDEAERGDRHRHHGARQCFVHDLAMIEVGFERPDHEGEHRAVEEPEHGGRNERGEPAARPEHIATARDEAERHDRQEEVGGEEDDVEHELQRAAVPAFGNHDEQTAEAREQHRRRTGEEQPEHQRDLAQRHRLGLTPHLDVQHEHLGHPEHHRHEPHRQPDAVRHGGASEEQRPPDRASARRAPR